MAFSTSALPSVAAATTDLWPTMSNVLMAPWQGSLSSLPSPRQLLRRREAKKQRIESSPPAVVAQKAIRTELPDFLRDVEFQRLVTPQTWSRPVDIHATIGAMSRQALTRANPLFQQSLSRFSTQSRPSKTPWDRLVLSDLQGFHLRDDIRVHPGGGQVKRFMSTMRQPISSKVLFGVFTHQPLGPLSRPTRISAPLQRRSMTSSGISKNLLGNREAAANRNPTSATAQLAFYQVLLKANMPLLVVERYQSGRFASNEAVTEAYQRALGMIASSTSAAAVPGSADLTGQAGGIAAHNTPLSSAQLQAVAQAVASRSKGAVASVAKGTQGTGAKDAPIHVVVDQTFGETFFKWLKFLFWFGFIIYISLALISLAIESLGTLKRPGGARADNEVKADKQKTRFADVHGCEEAKEELQELVEFLRNPSGFATLGGKMPKGILLVGPPGTGKTLLARAVAGEAGVPFFYMSGSEFEEVYVGVGAKRVRDLFAGAKAKSPSIVFIDELDAIGGKRNARDATYVKQTLNQLLTELDGFEQNSGVIIIGATNFPELLDKALTRPGRFDRHVMVDLPDVRGRLAILKHHAKKIKAAPEVDLQAIAQSTSGLSGAELESIVNQAAIHASKAKLDAVTKRDFDWARDKVIMGAERKSMVINPKEKEMTAYHEAGHALVSLYSGTTAASLYKVTILPRGMTLGHAAYLPEMDRYSMSVRDYLAILDRAMGGKVAEELIYGNDMVTSGVSSDLKTATTVAYEMVAQFGMSDTLGPVAYKAVRELSGETRQKIEMEVQRTLRESYERARKLLISKRKELDLLARALIEYETLDKEEVHKVIRGEKLKDRVPLPPGGMLVPRGVSPLEGLSAPGGDLPEGEEGAQPPPPPPAPPSNPANSP